MSNVALPVELTPDVVMEMGREWIDTIIKLTPLDEILLYHKSDEVLSHDNDDQIIAYLAQRRQSKH